MKKVLKKLTMELFVTDAMETQSKEKDTNVLNV